MSGSKGMDARTALEILEILMAEFPERRVSAGYMKPPGSSVPRCRIEYGINSESGDTFEECLRKAGVSFEAEIGPAQVAKLEQAGRDGR
jgi:hypothetical protein